MSRSLKLAATNGRSPARENLAQAIAARDRAHKALSDAQEAVRRAQRLVADAVLELETATAAVEAERLNHSNALAASLCGNVDDRRTDTSHSLRTARGRAIDAADHLESCKQALTQVEAAVEQPERLLHEAEERVKHAARAVMSDETAGWPAEMEQLVNHVTDRLAAFQWLIRREIVNDADPQHPQSRHADPLMRSGKSQTLLRRCQDLRVAWGGNDLALCQIGHQHPAVQSWERALERL